MPDATDLSQDPVRTVTETPTRNSRRLAKRIVALVLASFAVWLIATIWSVVRAPVVPQSSALVINDVSQLNPIRVDQIITPTTTNEIADAVRLHTGPISIAGARHSMGGQIAIDGALFIDMRRFDRILNFSPADKTITVPHELWCYARACRPASRASGVLSAWEHGLRLD